MQTVEVGTEEALLPGVLFGISNAGVRITDIEIKKPTLEDVFLDFARGTGEMNPGISFAAILRDDGFAVSSG